MQYCKTATMQYGAGTYATLLQSQVLVCYDRQNSDSVHLARRLPCKWHFQS